MSSPVLSVMSATIYAAASLAAAAAAWRNRRHLQARAKEWIAISGAFAVFAVVRFTDAEDKLRNTVRDLARQAGDYDLRTDWQRPMVAALLCGGILVIALVLKRARGIAVASPRSRFQLLPAVATIAMLLLIALRLVSLHAVDALLYRGGILSLNHLLDTGLTLFVLASAIAALRPRQPGRMEPSRGRRKRSFD